MKRGAAGGRGCIHGHEGQGKSVDLIRGHEEPWKGLEQQCDRIPSRD